MVIIIISAIAVIFYFLQSSIYRNRCFNNVTAEVSFKEQGVFEGEKTQLIETLYNRKWLPLWWLLIRFEISRDILFEKQKIDNSFKGEVNYKKDLFSLFSFQKTRRIYNIMAYRRGYYYIDCIRLLSGDLLGYYKFLMDIPASVQFYVYPAPIDTGEYEVPFEKMMGEVMTRRNLMEDPFQLRGIRDYTQFDSMKKINWNATARSGELKVNEYDFTSSQQIMLLLNVERFNDWDGDGTIEESIRIVSSIATRCLGMGVPVGLYSNGLSDLTDLKLTVDTGSSPDYSMVFHQQLACLNIKKEYEPFTETLKETAIKGDKSPLYILVSQYFGQDLQDEVQHFRDQGFNLYWILPKYRDTKLKLERSSDVFVWEVLDK